MSGPVEVKPGTVPLPSAWSQLGVVRGFDPEPVDNLRMLLLGPPGQGKSTFVSGIPRNLILDFDYGAHSVISPVSYRVHIKSYAMYDAVLKQLLADAAGGTRTFKTVTFETGDSWSDLLIQQFITEKRAAGKDVESIGEFGSKGSGYGLIRERALTDLNTLYYTGGYNWIVTGHLKEKSITVNNQESTVIRPSMFPILAGGIWDRSDAVGTISRESSTVRDKETRTLPGGRQVEVDGPTRTVSKYVVEFIEGSVEGKIRVPVPPLTLPVVGGWDVFVKAYNESAARLKAQVAAGQTP